MERSGRSGDKNLAFQACIELAKYYEHREKNIAEALYFAKKAESILLYAQKVRFFGKISYVLAGYSETFAKIEKKKS